MFREEKGERGWGVGGGGRWVVGGEQSNQTPVWQEVRRFFGDSEDLLIDK